MGNRCTQYCKRFTLAGLEKNTSPAQNGFRYCRMCSKYVMPRDDPAARCSCCNGLTRKTPHYSRQRKIIVHKRY